MLGRLRAARERAGLTQQAVAHRLAVPQSWVAKSESGERRLDVIELARLATLYGVALQDLVPPVSLARPTPQPNG